MAEDYSWCIADTVWQLLIVGFGSGHADQYSIAPELGAGRPGSL